MNEIEKPYMYAYLGIIADFLDFDDISSKLGINATKTIKQTKAKCDHWNYILPQQGLWDVEIDFFYNEIMKVFNGKEHILKEISIKYEAVIRVEFVVYHENSSSLVGAWFSREFIKFLFESNGEIGMDMYP